MVSAFDDFAARRRVGLALYQSAGGWRLGPDWRTRYVPAGRPVWGWETVGGRPG